MKAILSDVHGNLEALQAVLEDVSRRPVEDVYCLGDVVGYGPNPRECLALAMSWPVVLLGNHDHAAAFGLEGFNPAAGRAILWTRGQLGAPTPSQEAADERWAFLKGRPERHQEGDFLFVHGSPRDPLREYVMPHDVWCWAKMQALFALVGRYCFQGHTHLPGVFTESCRFVSAQATGDGYRLGGEKVMVNVGSVGQPRDGDWRACYVLLDGDAVRFRRVEYDVQTTARKIHEVAELDDSLGDRLREGR